MGLSIKTTAVGRNGHIPRQALRRILLDALDPAYVQLVWGVRVTDIRPLHLGDTTAVQLSIGDGHPALPSTLQVSALIGCDGIHSIVRPIVLPSSIPNTLNYLNTLVVLGITQNPSDLFHERVIQMSDGKTRIFAMPFDTHRCMWQLSYIIPSLEDASQLAKAGPQALKSAVLKRCTHWDAPMVLDMLKSTDASLITGYPVFDRDPVPSFLPADDDLPVTLLGDAAHPMSPFKGQGANQALLDALSLAHDVAGYFKMEPSSSPKGLGSVFRLHEQRMLKRVRSKVLGSRKAVHELHCPEFVDTAFQLSRRGFQPEDCDRIMALLDRLKLSCFDIPSLDAGIAQLYGNEGMK